MGHNQQQLFNMDPAPWEVDDAAEQLVASIVLPTGPAGTYDYVVPDPLRESVRPGLRVRIPFGRGNRTVVGYCVRVENQRISSRRLKPLCAILDSTTLLSPNMLELTQWMAEHYLTHWGQVLEAVVPTAVRTQAGTRETLFLVVSPEVTDRLPQLKLPKKQMQIMQLVVATPQPMTQAEVATQVGCTDVPIRTLRKKGLLHAERRRVHQSVIEEKSVEQQPDLELNAYQRKALATVSQALHAQNHQTILIHGITGSGKTEVYIQAIREVVSFGRQAIVLVPEISLTPQTRQRFRSRFEQVAVLHSHMTNVERHGHWNRIAQGHVQVIVGARSAVFAPTPHLGLIIIDEEHDASFKQDSAPRYHARNVALYRAQREGIPLVLGSATPSLESWHQARRNKYQLVELPIRARERPLPDVQTIDLRTEARDRFSRGALSRRLCQSIDAALRENGQVILLLNRRGFSTHIQCRTCGSVLRCPNCELTLTHHRQVEKAVCHYCDHMVEAPRSCPECGSPSIRYSGLGTQKLEAEVRARFPQASCLRMDSDAMQKHGSHETALTRFREGEVQILVGTQMIAKGLDFPNVTLVGVVNADTALHFPDFRAVERTFQLVTQVAGRTGRGDKGGRVLVQTFNPDHVAIQAATRHDFGTFAQHEIEVRQTHGYPPYASMIRLVVRGISETLTEQFTEQISDNILEKIETTSSELCLLGPCPAPLAKLRGKYRFHMLLRGPVHAELCNVVTQATKPLKAPNNVQWIVDVDPLDML